jgi:signal transduction histidine kinase
MNSTMDLPWVSAARLGGAPEASPRPLELQARADELARQAEELRASRQRIVTAQDTERRRLERDIHDGAQQSLVAMAVQLRVLKALLRKNPQRAESLADQLGNQATEALTELRNLARGIFPPLLADRGVAAALRSHVERGAGDIQLSVASEVEDQRYTPEVEAAIYFCIREALQNAAKHAPAAPVSVTLTHEDGLFLFEVRDAGPGFAPERNGLEGSGIQGMHDRLAAPGGELRVVSAPGRGTSIQGRLPVSQMLSSSSASSSLLQT